MSTYPKAYLRIDPNIDQVRPDLDQFIRLLCAANRQPARGRFRDRRVAAMVLGKGRLSRHLANGDLCVQPDGRLYVDGWDHWQEGDLSVGERMRRLRDRKRTPVTPRVTGDDTPPVTRTVTPPASPDRNATSGRLSSTASTSSRARDIGASPAPAREGPPDDDGLVWLSAHRAGIPEGGGLHLKLIGLVERHGLPKVIATWEAMPAGTGRQYVLGAENLLDTIARPNGRADAEAERETERKAAQQRRLDATRARIAELRGPTPEPPGPTPDARAIGAER